MTIRDKQKESKTQRTNYSFLGREILGKNFLNLSQLRLSNWQIYSKTNNKIEFLEAAKTPESSIFNAYIIVIEFKSPFIKNAVNTRIEGKDLSNILDKFIKGDRIQSMERIDNVIKIKLN